MGERDVITWGSLSGYLQRMLGGACYETWAFVTWLRESLRKLRFALNQVWSGIRDSSRLAILIFSRRQKKQIRAKSIIHKGVVSFVQAQTWFQNNLFLILSHCSDRVTLSHVDAMKLLVWVSEYPGQIWWSGHPPADSCQWSFGYFSSITFKGWSVCILMASFWSIGSNVAVFHRTPWAYSEAKASCIPWDVEASYIQWEVSGDFHAPSGLGRQLNCITCHWISNTHLCV